MCRIAAFPPGFARDDALKILSEMEGCNRDGVGSAYVRQDGKFMTYRFPDSLTSLLKTPNKFLDHMPYNGWTIAHLRLGTHGENTIDNTHPFVVGEWAVVHNGVWSEYRAAKLALSRSVRFKGETDSEVAAHLINVLGPKKFASEILCAGVFLALRRDGSLWVLKTSGMLEYIKHNNSTLIATDIGVARSMVSSFGTGYFKYSKIGKLVTSKLRYDYSSPKEYTHNGRVYSFPGEDEPIQSEIRGINDVPPNDGLGHHVDKDGHWVKDTPPEEYGPDGFPVSPFQAYMKKRNEEQKQIQVPRENERFEKWYDHHDKLPRHSPLPEIYQTTLP